jgi:ATP-binding cassette subfamily B protein
VELVTEEGAAESRGAMDHSRRQNICRFVDRPFAFIFHYVRLRMLSHGIIVAAVLAAVGCSVTTQYGLKRLVDALTAGPSGQRGIWSAFLLLVCLIAADNLLWRLAGWIASFTFVRDTGDLRRDLFRHLTGHSATYFSDRLPGTLTSRITATSNAVYTIENMFVWNVLPPCIATLVAIALVITISAPMAAVLAVVGGLVVFAMFKLAAAGKPLHHQYADKAARVDGEMGDVIGNMPLVRAFCGLGHERRRFDHTIDCELDARKRSLLYLERLRILHALVTVMLTAFILAWAITLWQRGEITTGDVVLGCTLGLSVLHATRDLAVALVDVIQHFARLSEALATLLVPHDLSDHPKAVPLKRCGASVEFNKVSFCHQGGQGVFENLSLRLEAGQRVGLVGPSGGGKTTLFALVQRFYDVQRGRILVDGQDITRVTQKSLRSAIAIVPQDASLLQRSILENIRYGRPDASDAEVSAAAHAARCDFIDVLPKGMATIVGDRGVKLSGGQRQRIAIARAFLKDAPLLLLDEATSALDSESEELIRRALGHLMRDRTVIAIAHRLSTVQAFDRIVVLRGGRIVQDGPPKQLMARDGLYRDLLRRQAVLEKEAA